MMKNVVILMGGASSEREVSLVTGRSVMEAIDTARYRARALEVGAMGRNASSLRASVGGGSRLGIGLQDEPSIEGPDAFSLARELLSGGSAPDVVFIAMHGRYGEDGAVQGMLETLGIPYTGSGVLASALAMDKVATKRLLQSEGLPTPAWCVVDATSPEIPDVGETIGFPVIVKPNREGSTIGVTLVNTQDEVAQAVEEALRHDNSALIEKFVTGMEITVGILEEHTLALRQRRPFALPVIEICPKSGFYDYEAKYTAGLTEKIVPARLDKATTRLVQDMSVRVHGLLGCLGMSRVDLIVTDEGPTILEVNTIPGMTPTSLLPRAAAAVGISFTELISRIIESGLAEGPR